MAKRIGSALPEIFRNLAKKPSTTSYPFKPIEVPRGFRGKLDIDPEKCTGCSVCATVCPAFVIEMVDAGTRRVGDRELPVRRPVFELVRCIFCGECVDNCRFGALRMTEEFELATPDKESLTMRKAAQK